MNKEIGVKTEFRTIIRQIVRDGNDEKIDYFEKRIKIIMNFIEKGGRRRYTYAYALP